MHYIFFNPYKSLCSFFEGEGGAGGGGETVVKENLNSIIENAATETAKLVGDKIEKDEKEVKTEDKKESKAESKDDKKDDLDEKQLGFAKDLYKALANPDKNIQIQTLQLLAKAAGLDLKEVETKIEKKEVEETLLDLLKQGLGEFDFLAEKLAGPLEKALNRLVEKQTKDTKEAINRFQTEKIQTESNNAIDRAFGKYENSLELVNEVKSLQDSFPPSKNLTIEQYFTKLLVLAAAEKGITLKVIGSKSEKDQEKINKNRKDVGSRLTSERGAEVKVGVKLPGKMNLNDAVASALESLQSEK